MNSENPCIKLNPVPNDCLYCRNDALLKISILVKKASIFGGTTMLTARWSSFGLVLFRGRLALIANKVI
jgi:hypothetical protein